MKNVCDLLASVILAILLMWCIMELKDHEKRLTHLESVTFDYARCPDNKSFSLVTVRP